MTSRIQVKLNSIARYCERAFTKKTKHGTLIVATFDYIALVENRFPKLIGCSEAILLPTAVENSAV